MGSYNLMPIKSILLTDLPLAVLPGKKPCILPKRTPSMTLSLAVKYPHGIVLATDSLITVGTAAEVGSFSYHENKIYWTDGRYFSASLAGATNDTEALESFAHVFLKKLEAAESEDAEILPNVESTLQSELQRFYADTGVPPPFTLLVSYTAPPSQISLFKSSGLSVRSAKGIEITGLGDISLLRYLSDSLYRPDLPLNEAIALAVLIVSTAKRYCSQYCGGQTNLEILTTEYPLRKWPSQREISNLENFFQTNGERYLRSLLAKAAETLR
jgi:20S proteasome alpha/beta subunit